MSGTLPVMARARDMRRIGPTWILSERQSGVIGKSVMTGSALLDAIERGDNR